MDDQAQSKQGPVVTEHTQMLFDALINRGVTAVLEHSDGHKHVDIAILEARIYIEVDGLPHFTNPEQIVRDFKRNHYSDGDDFDTIHIPNIVIKHHCNEVADAIAAVALSRIQNS